MFITFTFITFLHVILSLFTFIISYTFTRWSSKGKHRFRFDQARMSHSLKQPFTIIIIHQSEFAAVKTPELHEYTQNERRFFDYLAL